MKFTLATIAGLAATATSVAIPNVKRDGSISVTPHAQYSSAIGVLGCKIDTNRVAYWPGTPGCDSMCVKVSANGRSVNLLWIDSSGGAHDISYDAWNYLSTGKSATEDPTMGGGISATYETLDMSECADNINSPDGKLAFEAANSVNYVVSCSSNSWFSSNHALYNIADSTCNYGVNDVCTLDLSVSNQPSCAGSTLGDMSPLTSLPVWNIDYGTGEKSLATS